MFSMIRNVPLGYKMAGNSNDFIDRLFFRDIREYKSRVESYSREMLRKEAQIRDMQQRLENGDGSKFSFFKQLCY